MRRLFPEPGELEPVEAVAGLAGRDVLAVNMVASADGRAALAGRTAALSNEADRELFHALRTQADAILVGSGTLRHERYGRFTKDERRVGWRREAGREDEPIGVIITRSLDLPWDIPLFEDPGARVAIYTSALHDPPECAATVTVTRMDDPRPADVLEHLRANLGVRFVLCEGGPTLNRPLFAAGLVDELFLTLSPVMAGGLDPLTILEGDLPEPLDLELRQALEHEGALLLRYGVRAPG